MTTAPQQAPGKSVTERAFAVLMSFDITHRRMTLSQISRRTGLPVATTFRLLDRLEAIDAVERSSDGRYSIGPKIWELGILAPTHDIIGMGTRPLLVRLAAHAGAMIRVFVHSGQNALCVEEVLAHGGSSAGGGPGLTLPLQDSAAGHVVLSSLSPAGRTDTQIQRTQLDRLLPTLTTIDQQGWARRIGTDDTVEYAVPLDADGRPAMALSAYVPQPGGAKPAAAPDAIVRELWSVARTLAEILDSSTSEQPAPAEDKARSKRSDR